MVVAYLKMLAMLKVLKVVVVAVEVGWLLVTGPVVVRGDLVVVLV